MTRPILIIAVIICLSALTPITSSSAKPAATRKTSGKAGGGSGAGRKAGPAELSVRKFFLQLQIAPNCQGKFTPTEVINVVNTVVQIDIQSAVLMNNGWIYDTVEERGPRFLPVNQEPDAERSFLNAINARYAKQGVTGYALDAEFNCQPSSERQPYRLTLELKNIVELMQVRRCEGDECIKATAAAAVRPGYINFLNIDDDLRQKVRAKILELLKIPSVTENTSVKVGDPGEDSNHLVFIDPASGAAAGALGYFVRKSIVQLNGQYAEQICKLAEPLEYDSQVVALLNSQSGTPGPASKPPPQADPTLQQIEGEVVHDRVSPWVPERHPKTRLPISGAHLEFHTKNYEADYLLRSVMLQGDGKSSPAVEMSPPLLRCLRVRYRPLWIGIGVRVGLPWAISLDSAISKPTLGVDVSLAIRLPTRTIGKGFFPNQYLVPTVGFSVFSGTYPCGSSDPTACRSTMGVLPRMTTAWDLEMRLQTVADIYRVGRVTPRIMGEFGGALDWLSSAKPFQRDGLHGSVLIGAGLSLAFYRAWAQKLATNVSIGLSYQVRLRLPPTAEIGPTSSGAGAPWLDSAGIADGMHVLWIYYSAQIGLRHKT